MTTHHKRFTSRLSLAAAIVLGCALPSFAQSGSQQGTACRPALRVAPGALQPYLDEPWQFAGAGSVRACVTKRIAVEPEVVVSPGSHFERWMVTANVLVDLKKPGQVTPYAVGGIGYAREHDVHVTWRRSYLALNGGIGVRFNVGERLFVAPEFRLGDDLGLLVFGIGYHL
jgi:hypothetical protein